MASDRKDPVVTHVMEPALPGTYAVCTVGGATEGTKLYAAPLQNRASRSPGDGPAAAGPAVELPVVQRADECLTVELPPGPFCLYAVSPNPECSLSEAMIVNRPRLDWCWPATASPGECLRLLGRNLVSADQYRRDDSVQPVSFGGLLEGQTRVVARREHEEAWVEIPVERSSSYEARLPIPQTLTAGTYCFCAHSGLGGPLGWSAPLVVEVGEAKQWPTDVFRVDDFLRPGERRGHSAWGIYGNFGVSAEAYADNAIAGALAAAEKNGGGIVELSTGVYDISRTIVMPRRVVLRGAGMGKTWIRTPLGGGPKEPWVAITGDGDFAIEDLRLLTFYGPIAICAPTWLPKSFDEAANPPFNWSEVRARNVAVRRCHISQRPFEAWDRRLTACSEEEKKHIDRLNDFAVRRDAGQGLRGFNALYLRGDGIELEGNTIYGGGSAVMLLGCSSVRVAGNDLRAGTHGVGLFANSQLSWPKDFPQCGYGASIPGNYCHEFLIEDNSISGHSDRSRNGIVFMTSAVSCHLARNRVVDISRHCDGEGILTHLWPARWIVRGLRMMSPTEGEIIDPEGEVKPETLDGAVIEIVGGRGLAQMRTVLKREGSRVLLDRPWLCEPDETSQITFIAPPPFQRITFVDNAVVNAGAGIILWGCSSDLVVDGNYIADTPGIGVWSVRLDAIHKSWGGAAFTQVINNTLAVGTCQPDEKTLLAQGGLGTISNPCGRAADAHALGYDILGLVIRGNLTQDNSGIIVNRTFGRWGSSERWGISHGGVVVEDNFCRDSTIGVVIEEGTLAVERNNRAENVKYHRVYPRPT